MAAVLDMIREKFGGAEQYLKTHLHMTDDCILKLRQSFWWIQQQRRIWGRVQTERMLSTLDTACDSLLFIKLKVDVTIYRIACFLNDQ